MPVKRKTVGVFGMSFLDVMFCGFGAVILLVMLINHDTVAVRREVHADLRGEVSRLERRVLEGERYRVEVRNTLDETRRQAEVTRGRATQVLKDSRQIRTELAELNAETLARIEHVNALQTTLKSLDEDTRRLSAKRAREAKRGTKVRQFLGDGDRQYLTGLKMGGRRILILVDASASMLDETIVNVIRRRNLSEAHRRQSPKWRQVLATVEWLVSQLPASSEFQIYAFNTASRPVLEGSDGRWLAAGDAKILNAAVAALRTLVPADGTSLHRAFETLTRLSPRPDNVLLLTDGLPTQGASRPAGTKVSGDARLRFFQQAVATLPPRIPVNTILFPMEGDPLATSAFWKLAGVTHGAFISPSRDWP